jgi:hypothetical protein
MLGGASSSDQLPLAISSISNEIIASATGSLDSSLHSELPFSRRFGMLFLVSSVGAVRSFESLMCCFFVAGRGDDVAVVGVDVLD